MVWIADQRRFGRQLAQSRLNSIHLGMLHAQRRTHAVVLDYTKPDKISKYVCLGHMPTKTDEIAIDANYKGK